MIGYTERQMKVKYNAGGTSTLSNYTRCAEAATSGVL